MTATPKRFPNSSDSFANYVKLSDDNILVLLLDGVSELLLLYIMPPLNFLELPLRVLFVIVGPL